MNSRLFAALVIVASLAACGKSENAGETLPPRTDSASAAVPSPDSRKPVKAAEVLPGRIQLSFSYSVSSGRTVQNEDGTKSRIMRVVFQGIDPTAAALEIRGQYRKLGYAVADSDSGPGKSTYVARKADERIRYTVVTDTQASLDGNASGIVTFFWKE